MIMVLKMSIPEEKANMNRLKAWAPAILWMGVIFLMSAMPGDLSGEQSGRLVRLIMWLISLLFGEEAAAGIPPETISLLVRKGAHMAEYAVLFWCYRHALKKEGAKRPGLTALLLCATYAATDETHQAFVADRGPSPVDVGIDTLGACAAWCMTALQARIKKPHPSD